MFTPRDNKCIGCGKEVLPADRQEIVWNAADKCFKRLCESCIAKWDKTK